MTVVNQSTRIREIDVTSYAEIVLASPADDLAHPAFGKLFLETEYLADSAALLCHRRPRDPRDPAVWAVHVLSLEGRPQGPVEWETDRARFLGRGRDTDSPAALDGRALSGTTGIVLDPILSLRQRIRLVPGASVRLCFATASRRIERRPRRSRRNTATRARPRAPSRSPSRTRRAVCVIWASRTTRRCCSNAWRRGCSSPTARCAPARTRSRRTNSVRPACGRTAFPAICPSCSCASSDDDDVALVRQVLQAQEYWRLKGLSADVVILNEDPSSYLDEMHAQLTALLDNGPWRTWKHRSGGAYLLRGDRIGRRGAHAARGGRARGPRRGSRRPPRAARHAASGPDQPASRRSRPRRLGVGRRAGRSTRRSRAPPMTLANGLGGFTDDGRAYAIVLEGDQETPLPWANVIANPRFGTIVTASGSAHTWSENSRENRLTSFANDPIVDPTAEALFIRDDDSGDAWSPTPGPMARHPTSGRFVVRHSAGVTQLLARDARHSPRARRVRGRRRSREVLAAHADQRRRGARGR